MALKPFHIVLISAAILLGFGVGFWGLARYNETQNLIELQTGIVSFVLGGALFGYLLWFLHKMKQKGW